MTEILRAIRAAVKPMIKPEIYIGEVTAFDGSNWTIDVKLNQGAQVDQVTIRAVMNDEQTGVFVEPVVGSCVLVGTTDGRLENCSVLQYSEIVRMEFRPGESMILKSDSFGGLVKSEKAHAVDKKLVDEINKLKQILSSWSPVPNDGGAALKALLMQWMAQIPVPQRADYENKNIKHGE